MRTARSLRLAALAVPLLSALLLAGCSSSGSSSGSTSTTTATSSTGTASSPTTTSSASTVSQTCPSAAVVTAALGTTYPAPKSNSSAGTVICTYNDPSTSANLVLGFSNVAGLNAATLKSTADSQASAQQVTASAISGFGDAAYTFTMNDASTNASGIATTVMLVQVGSTLVDITAQATPAHVQALAHVVLEH